MHIFRTREDYLAWGCQQENDDIQNSSLRMSVAHSASLIGYFSQDRDGTRYAKIIKNRFTGQRGIVSIEEFVTIAAIAVLHMK